MWEAKLQGADSKDKTFRLSIGKRKTESAIWKLIDNLQKNLEWPYGRGTASVFAYKDGKIMMHIAV